MMTDDNNNTKKEPKLIIEANEGPEKADKTIEATPHEDEGLSLKEVIREQAIEDESPLASNFTLRKILGWLMEMHAPTAAEIRHACIAMTA